MFDRELTQEEYNALAPDKQKEYNDWLTARTNAAAANVANQAASVAGHIGEPAISAAALQQPEGATGYTTTQGAVQTGRTATQQSSKTTNTALTQGHGDSEQHVDVDWNEVNRRTNEDINTFNKNRGYIWDEEKQQWVSPTLLDVIGAREKLRQSRAEQQRRNRIRQLSSALYNSGAILSDIISAGVGGNVWKREKDETANKAADENNRLRELQAAEDVAFAEQERKRRDEDAKIFQQFRDKNAELAKTVRSSYNNSQSSSSNGTTVNNGVTRTQQSSEGTSATTYKGALTGKGLRGYSRSLYGGGSGSGKTGYISVRMKNGAHGEEYFSFALPEEEKNSLAAAVARSVDDAAKAGNTTAQELLDKYYTKKKRTDKAKSWDYDALIGDGALYAIPGVLNRYLDELTNAGMSHQVNGADVPYTRRELYQMMTGDEELKNLPAGVNLGQSRL